MCLPCGPRERYIWTIVLVTAIVAYIVAWNVLRLASDDSDSESSSLTVDDGSGTDHVPLDMDHANLVNFETTSTTTLNKTANVILILLDDAGWADFSLHTDDPYYDLATPNMDEIMTSGLYFTNYYTQSVCSPARASMLTGRWTWVLGVQKVELYQVCMNAHLTTTYPTWPEIISEKGYENYMWGKWHLGMDSWLTTPVGRGFNYWLGNLNEAGSSGGGGGIEEKGGWYSFDEAYWWGCDTDFADQEVHAFTITECLMRSWDYYYVRYIATTGSCWSFLEENVADVCTSYSSSTVSDFSKTTLYKEGAYIHVPLREHSVDYWENNAPADPRVQKRLDMIIFDEVLNKIEELSETPSKRWSMYLSLKTPHQDSAYLENGTNTEVIDDCARYFIEDSPYYSYDRGAICQQMYEVDNRIGEVIGTLRSVGLWDDTLIILTNDNGGTSGQSPGLTFASYNYAINWPLRGVKGSFFQGGVKTIMAITGGALPEGLRATENHDLHHVSDIAPTIAAIAGYSQTEISSISNGTNFDGVSLLSTSTVPLGKHDYIYLTMHSFTKDWTSNQTVIILSDGKKYIGPGSKDGEYGYWGTLPTDDSIGPKWENCTEGCIFNLKVDPYEKTDIGYHTGSQEFLHLVDVAYDSDLWNDGESFDFASCSECSNGCSGYNSTVEYLGFYYYPPWKGDASDLDQYIDDS